MPTPYTAALEQALVSTNNNHWSLVQPILSSSYTGFGHGSLQRDTQELDELFAYLTEHRQATGPFCIVGHSTGCQNAVHYMKHGLFKERLLVAALQAPVSDREGVMQNADYTTNLQAALRLRNDGRGDEMMLRSAFWAPITANRFLDLQEREGADDFFSSDYSDEELADRLRHVGSATSQKNQRKVLVAFSGADEYVPVGIDKEMLTQRLVNAMNTNCPGEKPVALSLYLGSGNHNLSKGPGDADKFIQKLTELLGSTH
jgi:hypothetical protein